MSKKIVEKVSTHGRIYLPKEIQEKYNIREGDYVTFEDQEDKIVIKKLDLG